MPEITEIKKARRGGYHISLDGEYAFTLNVEIFARERLQPGHISEEELDRVRSDSDRIRARERALYLLEYRSHSAKELFDKLAKNVPEQIAAETVAKMIDLGLIDDRAYAERLAGSLYREKKYGPHRIRQHLLQKGIDRETVSEVTEALLESLPEEGQRQQLLQLIEKKYARQLAEQDPKNLAKVQNALVRRGYGYEEIKGAIRAYQQRLETEESS